MANKVTVIGLGPGDWTQVTVEARDLISSSSEVWLRTARHPVVPALPAGLAVHSFDYLYDAKPTFEEVYAAIVEQLLALARRPEGVIYAVPGHPLMGERSVARLIPAAREAGIAVRLVAGVSFLEALCGTLEFDPLARGVQVLDAADLALVAEQNRDDPGVRPGFMPTVPLVLAQLYNRRVASAVKLQLLEVYPPGHQVSLVCAAGVPGGEQVRQLELHRLDHERDIDHLCSLYVPPLEPLNNLAEFSGLRYVVARLRGPGGCPWDREQTHDTLKP
jgi:tetrapyrrole methylase family protein / MazG family protein